jgi:hypothetical protein
MISMRIVAFLRRLLKARDSRGNEHTRLHGQEGKYVRFPTDIRELDEKYGPVMRELAKQ